MRIDALVSVAVVVLLGAAGCGNGTTTAVQSDSSTTDVGTAATASTVPTSMGPNEVIEAPLLSKCLSDQGFEVLEPPVVVNPVRDGQREILALVGTADTSSPDFPPTYGRVDEMFADETEATGEQVDLITYGILPDEENHDHLRIFFTLLGADSDVDLPLILDAIHASEVPGLIYDIGPCSS